MAVPEEKEGGSERAGERESRVGRGGGAEQCWGEENSPQESPGKDGGSWSGIIKMVCWEQSSLLCCWHSTPPFLSAVEEENTTPSWELTKEGAI